MTAGGPLSPDLARLMAAVADRPNVTLGQAMQNLGLMTGGKLFAFLNKGSLVLKLPTDVIDGLIDSHGAVRFDRGQGKPLREWVVVPPSAVADWPGLTRRACDFVAGL